MRARTASASSCERCPRDTDLPSTFAEYALPRSAAASSTSLSSTSMPARAHSYAMPAPIIPAPRTATRLGRPRLVPVRPRGAARDRLHVEEEGLDHVARDLRVQQRHEPARLDAQRGVDVDDRALDRGGEDRPRRRERRALRLLAQRGREHRRASRPATAWPASRRASCSPCGPTAARRPGSRRSRRGRAASAAPRACATTSSTRPSSWASAGRNRLPCSRTPVSACAIPSSRTVRTTPPPPGSRPSVTSGKPNRLPGASSATRWWQASAISRPPPSAAPLSAATTGRPYFSSRRSRPLVASTFAKMSAAVTSASAELPRISCRSPPGAEGGLAGRHDHAGDVVQLRVQPVERRGERRVPAPVQRVRRLLAGRPW